ncbi:AraC family transcriptional regulator [Duganella sp. LX20W]|uniref:AraC family transcriptional regulator n=1 Tax=Rugamonas brunnea TaxID=2758569 RepID=A0A7W2EP67_9BURK|nr:AraC family transcriptional regulator [Rugamonas brunnea]MBA5635929.1 AraC family transcriptional regulator [Rugamonas brunnea]
METLIRASTLTGYLEVASRHKLNALALLAEVGITAAQVGDQEQRVPLAAVCRLLELSAERSGCATFGLEMAALRQRRDVGPIGLLMSHARTLRESLLTAERYHHLLNDALAIHIETVDDTVLIREEIIAGAGVQTRQATELAVGVLSRICRVLLGEGWRPKSVNFTHAGPADASFHRRYFGCGVHFGREFNGIVCVAADLDAPNPAADQALVRYAESLAAPLNAADHESIVFEVRRAIYLLLPLNEATVDGVAVKLRLSGRSLQRHLREHGTEFIDLLSDVRHELAVRYLGNPRFPIGRIAALLGYTRQASFTRWFISRFGKPPSAWRAERFHPNAPPFA